MINLYMVIVKYQVFMFANKHVLRIYKNFLPMKMVYFI